MTVHLDTSVLIDALAGPRPLLGALTDLIDRGDRPAISTLALYEWLHRPRARLDLVLQEDLFPRAEAVPFGALEADMAAKLHIIQGHPRRAARVGGDPLPSVGDPSPSHVDPLQAGGHPLPSGGDPGDFGTDPIAH